MPLSEYEQRILSEIEQRLAAEDPRFARDVAATSPYGQSVKRLKRASLAFGGGFALLIAGLVLSALGHGVWLLPFGLAAFGIMLGSSVLMVTIVKHIGREHVRSSQASRSPSWFNRFEERWRRRFERGEDS
ncbi:MAG: DUF3040 domain-containing protein [Actinomycetota bacterium]|nr:DUF3040 domain-containing protein [Actinomycetota bacterium]